MLVPRDITEAAIPTGTSPYRALIWVAVSPARQSFQVSTAPRTARGEQTERGEERGCAAGDSDLKDAPNFASTKIPQTVLTMRFFRQMTYALQHTIALPNVICVGKASERPQRDTRSIIDGGKRTWIVIAAVLAQVCSGK